MNQKTKNKSIINFIIKNRKAHIPNTASYNKLKTYFRRYFGDHLKKKKSQLYISYIGKFKLPYFKMGNINSFHLLGLDEIIIFTFYIAKKNKIIKVADLGANIGMHSIVLDKLGYNVKSYEPDPIHIKQFIKNKKLNNLKNVRLIRKAVDIKKGNVEFTKIINNTTGSFIKNAKKPFGPTEKFRVKTESFKNILKWAELIKMDVEGLEADLISSIKYKDLFNKEIILEVGSQNNAKKIFKHAKKNKFNLFSQKIGWNLIKSLKDVPTSYKEGSLIITSKSKI